MNSDAESMLNKAASDLKIKRNTLEAEKEEKLERASASEAAAIEKEYAEKQEQAVKEFKETVSASVESIMKEAGEEVVRKVETDIREKKKRSAEDGIKDHLRGFSRTIPSFLMAYGGDHDVTLESFDQIVPAPVFLDVTSITLDNFRFLRDGGPFINSETGKEEQFKGHLFDPVVFNDSVKEFLGLKKRLADYFDENATEDIFDYIPPQKTFQIFTPKRTVKEMVDLLEKENPGCFDDPEKTFADLYMKSGLYITEIVKRLYNSPKITECYPDREERLDHIFSNQVYGLAPTEIIYRIALSFILGFDGSDTERRHNFRMLDALPYAKEGTLEKKLDEVFG